MHLFRFLRLFTLAAILVVADQACPQEKMQIGGLNEEVSSDLSVTELKCDSMTDPMGVDSSPPRLSWQLRGSGRNQRQTAWQVVIASSAENLSADRGEVWDSGKVMSGEQLFRPYAGRALKSGERVVWKVRVWDEKGRASAWSAPASWTMGLLAPSEWKARWITDPELLRWLRPRQGYHSEESKDAATTKWIQVDLGATKKIDAVRLYALRYTVPERLGFPLRFKIELSDDPSLAKPTLLADQTLADVTQKNANLIDLPGRRLSGRYLRLTATKLRAESGVACLAFSQIEVLSGGKNIAVGAKVTASDSWERDQWSAAAVVDGLDLPRANPRANSTLLLRREFTVRNGIKRALLFVSGLGHYEASLNGIRVGQGLLTPGWTAYDKTRLYDTYDVTALLKSGANAAGLCLGSGMYNVQEGRYVKFTSPFKPLTAIAQLRIDYDDGQVEEIATDEHWRVAKGPITFSNVYGGEDYDARLEPVGWNQAGFNDQAWTPAVIGPDFQGKLLGASESSPAFRTYETLAPVTVKQLRTAVSVYDFGQNAAVMPRLRVRGGVGAVVKLRPAELLLPDGRIDTSSCMPANAEVFWSYTLSGTSGGEEWFPKFFYQGCRYLQVELSPGKDGKLPVVESLQTVVVHSDSPSAGEFACSNELFNRIHGLVRWAQRSNLAHVITDCPHRERLGWLEQYHLNGPSLRCNFDLTRLYAKTFQDMADSQLPNGLVPDIAPEYVAFPGGFRDSPEWGSALILAALQHLVWTGDDAPLRRHYDAMTRYVSYLDTRAEKGILSHGLGDWYDLGPKRPGVAQLTPIALTATAIYYECNRAMAQIASRLGRSSDAAHYQSAAEQIAEAFNRKFFNNGVGIYATGSQTAQAMPLVLNIPLPDFRGAVVTALVRDIEAHGNGITAGDVGYRYLLRALAGEGRSDLIYAMNNQSDKPGYGYQLARGCTSLAEAWTADRSSSQNHFMLGQIEEWFFQDLAGLAPDLAGPGFQRLILHPQPVEGMEWARARLQSPRGPVTAGWKKADKRFLLRAEIPANTQAELWLPARPADQIEESGESAAKRPGVHFERWQNGYAIFSLGSGDYDFAVISE